MGREFDEGRFLVESSSFPKKSRSLARFRGLGMTNDFFGKLRNYSPRMRSLRDSRLRTTRNLFFCTRISAGLGREL